MVFIGLLIGCTHSIDLENLVFKDGLYYEVDSNEPYTGDVKVFYSDDITDPGVGSGLLSYAPDWYKNIISNLRNKKGQLIFETKLNEGKIVGALKEWYENGQLRTSTVYDNGVQQEYEKEWYENGQLKTFSQIENGYREGNSKDWYINGQLKQDGMFHYGDLTHIRAWYQDGQLRIVEEYQDNKMHGLIKSWYHNGQLQFEGNYSNGNYHGLVQSWNENGQKVAEEIYENGEIKNVTVTDIDGNKYGTIRIGNQTWMTENLKVTHYRDGTKVKYLKNSNDWSNAQYGAYCFNDNEGFLKGEGMYYNWFSVSNKHKLSPKGWHIPSKEEWQILVNNIGGYDKAGFNGLLAGYRDVGTGSYYQRNKSGYYWTSTESSQSKAHCMYFFNYEGRAVMSKNELYKRTGFSIRCIKD